MKPKFTDNRYPNGYVRSEATDIRKTFERIRRDQKANAKEVEAKVEQIKPRLKARSA